MDKQSSTPAPASYPCQNCGAEIDASKPFIRCDREDCPEKSGKSLLDMLLDDSSEAVSATPAPANPCANTPASIAARLRLRTLGYSGNLEVAAADLIEAYAQTIAAQAEEVERLTADLAAKEADLLALARRIRTAFGKPAHAATVMQKNVLEEVLDILVKEGGRP